MEIRYRQEGRCSFTRATETSAAAAELVFPLIFDLGPKDYITLHDCRISGLVVDGEPVSEIFPAVRFTPHRRPLVEIEYPVLLRRTGESSVNDLDLHLRLAHLPDQDPTRPVEVSLQIAMTVQDRIEISFVARARCDLTTGLLAIDGFERVHVRGLVTANLAALVLCVLAIYSWNVTLNADVYGATGLFKHENIDRALFLILGFLGFPILTLLDWLRRADKIAHVLRAPELYLSRPVVAALRTPWLSGVVALAFSLVFVVAIADLSFGKPESPKLAFVSDNRPIEDQRIRRTDLRNVRGICSTSDSYGDRVPTMASLVPPAIAWPFDSILTAALEWRSYELEVPAGRASDLLGGECGGRKHTEAATVLVQFQIDEDFSHPCIAHLQEEIRAEFCREGQERAEDYQLEITGNRFTYRPSGAISFYELDDLMGPIEHAMTKIQHGERVARAEYLIAQIPPPSEGEISRNVFLAFYEDQLEKMRKSSPPDAFKNAVLLNAGIRIYSERSSDVLREEDFLLMAKHFAEFVGKTASLRGSVPTNQPVCVAGIPDIQCIDRNLLRAYVRFLLAVGKRFDQTPGSIQLAIAIQEKLSGMEYYLDYLTACLATDCAGASPHRKMHEEYLITNLTTHARASSYLSTLEQIRNTGDHSQAEKTLLRRLSQPAPTRLATGPAL